MIINMLRLLAIDIIYYRNTFIVQVIGANSIKLFRAVIYKFS